MIYKHFQQAAKGKEKTSRAAVIRYDKDKDRAPTVVAHGRGQIAEKIIAKAKEHDIPLQEDAMLLENLLDLDLGSNVPPQLYQVVAEILLLVRRANIGSAVSVPLIPAIERTPYWEEEDDEIWLEDSSLKL
ncbi:flagellar biosynthesis protein [Aneurinibacillus thermoaerophilus]|jgi:flagellar biosynthesis protein|uniref:EscU/YscU/HrcU family type III secretion system export apparatus switch protein n=1 Tax=Aneurinibacillus thermoaerophilus TaxID=143495 RepID=A0A1G8EEN1_ANETH|nr:EscU/YscU/HrcU family type III secretion system export apparatus switch protein [Aneurinibacillus thermoaerophilus]SDH68392.1 flagellar biosynthesis protein [Aneurinibacillus thermoaerophilus]